MRIGGIQKTSLLDFPDRISAIVFTQGCNFRCGYCHNPELITMANKSYFSEFEFWDFLNKRIGKLEGVVITGGEPCLQPDLRDFIVKIKNLGFAVKLDTNGAFPNKLEECLPFIDYVAMDIKAPLSKYSLVTKSEIQYSKIQKSIKLIMNSGCDYEFRTTVVKSQLNIEDFIEISNLISGAKRYYLQKFIPSKILDNKMVNENSYTDIEFEGIVSMLKTKINFVDVR